ncbi:hypothetical protein SMC26_03415 [Actinomadura fulvescens]
MFAALRTLLSEADTDLEAWLRSRRPASATDLLGALFADVMTEPATAVRAEPEPAAEPRDHSPAPDLRILLGLISAL